MIDVVIVNWNAGQQLRQCVDSLIAYGPPFVSSIVVVDNGSTDGSERSINPDSCAHLIANGSNLGFGRACNIGAQRVASEFLLFLNPDAAIFPGTLQAVVDYMRQPDNRAVGICGVQLLDEAGHIGRCCARLPSIRRMCLHAIGLDRFSSRCGMRMAEWDHLSTRIVDQVMGSFFFVRRELFEALSGFDERFFVYFEEVDFSARAKNLGFSSVYLSSAQAFHAGGGTSRQVKARRLFYSLRSRLLYAFKHFSRLGAWTVLTATLCVEPVLRVGYDLVRLRFRDCRNTIRAYLMLLGDLPHILVRAHKP